MDNDDEGLILGQKFKILKKIGSGSFGYIYMCNFYSNLGESLTKKEKFAVKIVMRLIKFRKKRKKVMDSLQYEIKLYQTFQGIGMFFSNIAGIAKLHDYGYEG
jgi:hypothetical protein